MNDPLATARGIAWGLFASLALVLFMLGAAVDSSVAGGGCMFAACIFAVLAMIVGGNRT